VSTTAERPVSFGKEIPPEERKSIFRRVRIKAHESRETVLSLLVPEAWQETPQDVPSERPGWYLLRSYAPVNTVSLALFQANQEHEVNLSDWLEVQADSLAWTLTASQTVATEHGDFVHAGAISANGDRFRLVVAGDGPNLFFLIARVAATEPPRADEVLGLIAGSLVFKRHTGLNTREELKAVSAAGGEITIVYPKSWILERTEVDNAVDFRIASPSDTLAYAHVVYDPDKPHGPGGLRGAFDDALAEVKQSGVQVGKLDRIAPLGGGGVERVVGRARVPAGEALIFFAFREGKTGWIRAVILGPGKELNPLVWMRARRFFELLCVGLEKAKEVELGGKPPG
jgi:hypothetical protein